MISTMTAQELEDQIQFINYKPVFYDFPKFVQEPAADYVIPEIEVTYTIEVISSDIDFTSNIYQAI